MLEVRVQRPFHSAPEVVKNQRLELEMPGNEAGERPWERKRSLFGLTLAKVY